MTLPPLFWNNLLIAAGLGLAVGVSLWLLRRSTLGRRLRVSASLAVVGLGTYLAEVGLDLPADDPVRQVTLAVVVLVTANTLLQLFDWLFWDLLLTQRRHLAVPRLVVDLFNFVVLAIVAVAVLNRVFDVQDLSAFLVTSTVLSAVIGLAVQDTLANVAAGLALQAEHPFTVGDWVRLSGEEGQVVQMNWRTITLRARDNHNVLLPNTNAAKELIVNYSRPTPLQRLQATVGVAYGHPPEQVKAVLNQAAASAAGVVSQPPPQALVQAYGDFAVEYLIYFWITDFDRVPEIQDAVMTRLWYALRRAGFGIPFPVRDVTVRMLGADHAAEAQARQQREVFTELRRIALFASLPEAAVTRLAQSAVLQPYAPGEVLVRQGDPGQSLFVIKAGRVRVEARGEAGPATPLARLGPDDFFGELSLLTGEPRSASVIAEVETEVVVVDKAGLADAIAADARLPEALSEALAARQRHLAEQVSAAGAAGRPASPPPTALLARIRRFFGLN